MPEAWLSGPIEGINPYLMPAAHACAQAREDVSATVAGLTFAQIWTRPHDAAASVGFHMMHLAGSLDRLFTYARGEALSDTQKAALQAEQGPARPEGAALIQLVRDAVDRA